MEKQAELECEYCKNIFTRPLKYVNYDKKKGQDKFYCSRECRCKHIKMKVISLECSFCKCSFDKSETEYNKVLRKGRTTFYCSKSCGNRDRKLSDDTRRKMSEKTKEYYKTHEHVGIKEKIHKNCPICKNDFEVTPCYENRTYCSRQCCDNDTGYKYKIKPDTGGYRQGSGRSLGGWYKGIYCDSTYELVYLIYCLDHNIKIERCKERFPFGDGRTYNPDFVVGDKIIEIKGYMTEEVIEKAKSIPSNIEYEILTKIELKKHFDYIKEKYGKTGNSISELYDDYKPKFVYNCDSCGEEFSTNQKRLSKQVFCSRSCSGKRKR